MRLRLQARYSLMVVGLLVAMIGLLVGAHLIELRSAFGVLSRSFGEIVTTALFNQVRKQGEGVSRSLATALADPMFHLEVDRIADLIGAARQHDGVLFIAVYDRNDRTLAATPGRSGSRPGPAPDSPAVREAMAEGRVLVSSDTDTLYALAPIMVGRNRLGVVKVGLSLAEASKDIARLQDTTREVMQANQQRFITIYLGIAAVTVLIGLGATLWMVRGLVEPIRALSYYTRRIGAGNYDEPSPVSRDDELGDLAHSLGEMARDLKQVAQVARLATLGEMAVGMAHELSQPLNTIRLAAENTLMGIEAGRFNPEVARAKLALISGQAESMGELIKRMCVVGRSQGPQDIIDPRESVRDAYSLLAGQYEAEGIAVTLDLAASCPLVLGRRNELAQVVINLLTNAHDAIIESVMARKARLGPTGGRIEITVERGGASEVLIKVKDNGGGVPAEVVDRIFDPFFTTKEVTKGTGLGLSISYGIVNAMGGRITVENFGGGALFTIRLPAIQEGEGRRNAGTIT